MTKKMPVTILNAMAQTIMLHAMLLKKRGNRDLNTINIKLNIPTNIKTNSPPNILLKIQHLLRRFAN